MKLCWDVNRLAMTSPRPALPIPLDKREHWEYTSCDESFSLSHEDVVWEEVWIEESYRLISVETLGSSPPISKGSLRTLRKASQEAAPDPPPSNEITTVQPAHYQAGMEVIRDKRIDLCVQPIYSRLHSHRYPKYLSPHSIPLLDQIPLPHGYHNAKPSTSHTPHDTHNSVSTPYHTTPPTPQKPKPDS